MELTLRVNTQAGSTVIRVFRSHKAATSASHFECTVSSRGEEYRSWVKIEEFREVFDLVRSATISPLGECALGLDGVSYELTIEEGVAQATYRWWMAPSPGWAPLAGIARHLLALGTKTSGQYLP